MISGYTKRTKEDKQVSVFRYKEHPQGDSVVFQFKTTPMSDELESDFNQRFVSVFKENLIVTSGVLSIEAAKAIFWILASVLSEDLSNWQEDEEAK